MINFQPEQFVAAQQTNVEAFQALSTKAYAGFEKMVELNMAASKALLGESFAHAQAVLAAKDAKELMDLQAGLVQPMTEKSVAYARHVQAITTEAGTELSSAVEARVQETQAMVAKMVENLSKNAPAGTESAVAAFKNALTTSQNALDAAQKTAKKAIAVAETNFTEATDQAVKAVSKAAQKA